VEKHELSKVEFEIIDKALKALQQSNLDPVTADKVIERPLDDVRFTPKIGHQLSAPGCPLCAKSGRSLNAKEALYRGQSNFISSSCC
jgi:hypothetical protein